jgi:hypothetical protein
MPLLLFLWLCSRSSCLIVQVLHLPICLLRRTHSSDGTVESSFDLYLPSDGSTRVIAALESAHLVIGGSPLNQLMFGQRYQSGAILELLTLVAHYAIHRHTHLWMMINELCWLVAHNPSTVGSALLLDLSEVHGGPTLLQEIVILGSSLGHTFRIATRPL